MPSIAAKLDANGEDYLLLDRDERFSTLRHYEPFDLRSPSVSYAFDALFLDPPFANVTPEELRGGRRRTLWRSPGAALRRLQPQRGAELVGAFGAYDLRDTGDVLGYATGVMEGRISLFTNWRP